MEKINPPLSKIYQELQEEIRYGLRLISLNVVGSHSYNLQNEKSDIDLIGIYIQPSEEILGITKYQDKILIKKDGLDILLYELSLFLKTLIKGSPNCIEAINSIYTFVPEGFDIIKSSFNRIILLGNELMSTKKYLELYYAYSINLINQIKPGNAKNSKIAANCLRVLTFIKNHKSFYLEENDRERIMKVKNNILDINTFSQNIKPELAECKVLSNHGTQYTLDENNINNILMKIRSSYF